MFVVVATKFKMLQVGRTLLELSLTTSGQLTRLDKPDQLVESVRGVQQFAALRASLAAGGDVTQGEASLDLCSPGSNSPRYSLFLAERPLGVEDFYKRSF